MDGVKKRIIINKRLLTEEKSYAFCPPRVYCVVQTLPTLLEISRLYRSPIRCNVIWIIMIPNGVLR